MARIFGFVALGLVSAVATAGIVGCGAGETGNRMGSGKMGRIGTVGARTKMGSDKMDSGKMGDDRMMTEKMESDRMSKEPK